MTKKTLEKANNLKKQIDEVASFLEYFSPKGSRKELIATKTFTNMFSCRPRYDINRQLNIDGELGEKIYNLLCEYKADLEQQFENLRG